MNIGDLGRFYLRFKGRADDIYIATYMRSGTTWMQMILYQLLTDGNMEFDHIYDVSPFIERSLTDPHRLERLPSPRFFKTHVLYEYVPDRLPGRFIYVMRDGRDVAVSLYHHYLPMVPDLTFQQAFDEIFLKLRKGWFHHLSGWLRNRKRFNILYIRYEDMKADLERTIREVAEFCHIGREESHLSRVVERSGFGFMKKYQSKFEDRRNVDRTRLNDFIRRGEPSEWRRYFTRRQLSVYREKFEEFLADLGLECYSPDR